VKVSSYFEARLFRFPYQLMYLVFVWTLKCDLVINSKGLKSPIIDITRPHVAAANRLFSSSVSCFCVCKMTNRCSLVGYIVVCHSINVEDLDLIIIPHEWHHDMALVIVVMVIEHIFTCKIIKIWNWNWIPEQDISDNLRLLFTLIPAYSSQCEQYKITIWIDKIISVKHKGKWSDSNKLQ